MTDVVWEVQAAVVLRATAPFEEFYASVWPVLYDFAATLVRGDRVLAEEITQETLARVYVRYARLDDPRPYAYRVAANLVKRRWHVSVREPVHDPALLPQRGWVDDVDHTVDAVRRLPPRLAEVVLLHYYADLPVEAVARLLHRPAGTVKARLHEARKALAIALGEDTR